MAPVYLNTTLYRFIRLIHCNVWHAVMYICLSLVTDRMYNQIVNITNKFLIKISISKYVRNVTKDTPIEDWYQLKAQFMW